MARKIGVPTVQERLRVFRKHAGMSMEQLAKAMGYKHASGLQHYENDEYEGHFYPVEFAQKAAKALAGKGSPALFEDEVFTSLSGVHKMRADFLPPLSETPQHLRTGRLGNFPVYRRVAWGPHGLSTDEDGPDFLGWWPNALMGVKEGFGLYMPDDAMHEAGIPAGTIVHVNPARPPSIGRICVAMTRSRGGIVRRYDGSTDDEVLLWQSNPKKELRLPKEDVAILYRVVGLEF